MKKIKKQTVVTYGIILCTLICWALIWPAGIFKAEKISRTAADYSMNTGPIGEVAAIQEFIPQYDTVKSIGIDIGKQNGAANQGTLYLHFYDENLQEFTQVSCQIPSMEDGELTDIPVNLELEAGRRYYVGINCSDYGDMPPVLHYRSLSGNGPVENLHFYYGPTVIEDASANIRFIYGIPLNIWQILFYDSLILLLAVAAIATVNRKYDGEHEQFDSTGKENGTI